MGYGDSGYRRLEYFETETSLSEHFIFLFTLQNHKKQDHSRSAIRLGETAPDIPYPNNYQNLTGTTSSKDRSTKKCSRGSDQIFQTDTMCWRIIRKIPRCGSRYGWFPELNQFFLVHKSGKMNIRIVVFRWQTDISNAQTIRSRQQCSINMTLNKIFLRRRRRKTTESAFYLLLSSLSINKDGDYKKDAKVE